jgi:DNA polymerase-4
VFVPRVPIGEATILHADLDSFYASVEQRDDVKLRGRPVAVGGGGVILAASYEAKAFGVKTGTAVWEAKRLCPGIKLIEAGHQRYVTMHHRIVDAVGSCLPIEKIKSVDEMVGKLIGDERKPEKATELGRRIKAAIYARAGDYMRCSIGIAPNELLAKMAADMNKPNGLTLLADADLPSPLKSATDTPVCMLPLAVCQRPVLGTARGGGATNGYLADSARHFVASICLPAATYRRTS